MWDLLINNISRRGVSLAAGEVEIIKTVFVHKSFRKHQYIQQQGEVVIYDNFIVKGICRTYRADEKGQEHILRFSPEDWWAGDLGSFLSGSPSIYNVDCLEDTEVLRITKADLESLFDRVPTMNKYFRVLYQKNIVAFSQRVTSNLEKPAAERYEEFIKQYSAIEQRVPNHQIASYLGITPQSLSRIRSQSLEKRR
jgi:CRP-like cAMP-binding protein